MKLTKLFSLIIIPMFLSSFSFALTLEDDFESGKNFWTNSGTSIETFDATPNRMLRINDNEAWKSKTYFFGAVNANTDVNVSLRMCGKSGWENSGSSRDRFRLWYYNGNWNNHYDGYPGSGTFCRNFSFTSKTDSLGRFALAVWQDMSYLSSEKSYIDDIKISTAPQTPVLIPDTFILNIDATDNTLVGTVNATGTPTSFSILSGDIDNIFRIDSFGRIYVNNSTNLDNNTSSQYTLKIEGTNAVGSDDENYIIKLVDDIPMPTGSLNDKNFDNLPILTEDGYKNSITISGAILQIGNQYLCKNSSNGADCVDPTTSGNTQNNYHTQYRAQIDKSAGAPSGNTMAKLIMDNGDKVVMARLYWSARHPSNPSTATKETIKRVQIKGPNSASYTELVSKNADFFWRDWGSGRFDYVASADVTQYVRDNGSGEYYVGDIKSVTGAKNIYASWQLIVIVENDNRSAKNITIYHGFKSLISDEVTVSASNFLTPTGTDDFDANLFIYMGESDRGYGDQVKLENSTGFKGLSDGLGKTLDVVNASVYSPEGYRDQLSGGSLAKPNYRNVLGVDIDKLPINKKGGQQLLENSQTSTRIKLISESNSAGSADLYSLNMFAFETEVYIPEFCYDYAYKQNGKYFTEDNDGSNYPKLTGNVDLGSPVELSIYIKNKVDSSLAVENMELNIVDLNTSQVKYNKNHNGVSRTLIHEITPTIIPNNVLSIDDENIKHIPIGNLGALDYFYVDYELLPQRTTLNTPINVIATYSLVLDSTRIDTPPLKLSEKIPMCTTSNFTYLPAKGIFNVVHNQFYTIDSDPVNGLPYYNLPTQVSKREGDFKVISTDPDDTDVLVGRNTVVAIEMIDVAAFHFTEASCKAVESNISKRVWVTFENNATSQQFDKSILEQAPGVTSRILNSYDFYTEARRNAAFRATYNSADDDGNIIQVLPSDTDPNNFKLVNFNRSGEECATDNAQFVGFNSGSTQYVNDYCTTNMTQAELTNCMECIYGKDTRYICSRDNFAIRPEAFDLKLYDDNETNSVKSFFNKDPNDPIELAAGYDYRIEVTAVNHRDENPTQGYHHTLEKDADEFGFEWEVRTVGLDENNCNDTESQYKSAKVSDGYLEGNFHVDQVGEYKLKVLDKTWALVDSEEQYRIHHIGNYFLDQTYPDCVKDESFVYGTDNGGTVTTDDDYPTGNPKDISQVRNGCDISSSHTNKEYPALNSPYTYADYNTTIFPYKFDVNDVQLTSGTKLIGGNQYIYMANVANDNNMSVHLNGKISAMSKIDTILSNYVDGCFANDIDINTSKTAISGNSAYNFRLQLLNQNGATLGYINGDLNATDSNISVPSNYFSKNDAGTIETVLNMNFARNQTTAVNPEKITFSKYTVGCKTDICKHAAHLNSTKVPLGELLFNNTITHYYGRAHGMRQKFVGTGNKQAFINYEIYCDTNAGCDKTILPNGATSKYSDDPRWFINETHVSDHGLASNVRQLNVPVGRAANPPISIITQPSGNHQDSVTVSYDGTRGYPYIKSLGMNASPWLIYNRFNNDITLNEFMVEFYNSDAGLVGSGKTSNTVKNKKDATNERLITW